MFTLRTPRVVARTNIAFDDNVLAAGHCGLFRCSLDRAAEMMPEMAELVASVPLHPAFHADYEIDIKVHMLMPGQYPGIPNWHTDMVLRDESGLRFDMIAPDAPRMLLWISDGPETEFLYQELEMPAAPGSHIEIARFLHDQPALVRQELTPNTWTSMDQATPHRCTRARKHGWRVFARVTHKSLAPAREVRNVIRRHSQVYLDVHNFGG